jgi:glycosyltransferase involved in cell wall biosynthesis
VTEPVKHRVQLVASPQDAPPPWPLSTLQEHLQYQGHDVLVTDAVDRANQADVDVVHAFGWTAARALAAREPGVPWALTAPWQRSGSDADVAEVARGAGLVVCASSEDASAANRLGVPRQRCLVLPIAVDEKVFTRLGPGANRTAMQRVVVQAVGPGDGVLDVITALRALPDAELVVLVDGDQPDDGPYHQVLHDVALEAGVRDKVAFVPARDAIERAWLLRSADVVVSAGRDSGHQELVAEAMACGKGVVVTPTGPQRDLVVHDVTGLHVPSGHVRALALSLRQLLADPFRLEGMGLAGADRALSRSTWPRVAHELGAAYARVSGCAVRADDDDPDGDGIPDDVSVGTWPTGSLAFLPGPPG